MDEERGAYTEMRLTVQVADRQHLARIKRGLRHISEVAHIARARD
jgi:(p)ppGpp synthase/HD superfamily hydrolase